MAVYNFVRPVIYNDGLGFLRLYGCGQYFIADHHGGSWFLCAHTADGKAQPDDTPLTDRGPPVVTLGVQSARAALQ